MRNVVVSFDVSWDALGPGEEWCARPRPLIGAAPEDTKGAHGGACPWSLTRREAEHFSEGSAEAEKVIETRGLTEIEAGAEAAGLVAVLNGVG